MRSAGDHEIRRDVVLKEVLQHVRPVGDPVLFEPEMLVGVDKRRFLNIPGQIGHEDPPADVRGEVEETWKTGFRPGIPPG